MNTKNNLSQKVLKYIAPSIITGVTIIIAILSIPDKEAVLHSLQTTCLSSIIPHQWIKSIQDNSSTILLALNAQAVLIATLTKGSKHKGIHIWTTYSAAIIPIIAVATIVETLIAKIMFPMLLSTALLTILAISHNNGKPNIPGDGF